MFFSSYESDPGVSTYPLVDQPVKDRYRPGGGGRSVDKPVWWTGDSPLVNDAFALSTAEVGVSKMRFVL